MAYDGIIETNDISRCVPIIDTSKRNRTFVQKVVKKGIFLTVVIMKERHFIRMCLMLLFFFDLGKELVIEKPQNIIVGFENNNVDEQTDDATTFDVMNVTECYWKIGGGFYPDDRMNLNYGTNNYNEDFKEIVTFRKIKMDYLMFLNRIKIMKHSKVFIEYMYLTLEIKTII